MTDWHVKGNYIEACNCEAVCPCIVFSPPTDGECVALLGWNIDKGYHGDTPLDGLNVAMLAHVNGNMKDGNWKVVLYIDERADDAQQEALQGIFSGAQGGHLANLSPLIGEVLGVESAPISISFDGKQKHIEVGNVTSVNIEAIEGQGGGLVQIQGHPLAPVPGVPFTVMRSEQFQVSDHGISCDVIGKNAFTASFVYQP